MQNKVYKLIQNAQYLTIIQTWNLSQTLHGQDFSIISLPEKHVNYDKLTFATKQRILYIHIINHH